MDENIKIDSFIVADLEKDLLVTEWKTEANTEPSRNMTWEAMIDVLVEVIEVAAVDSADVEVSEDAEDSVEVSEDLAEDSVDLEEVSEEDVDVVVAAVDVPAANSLTENPTPKSKN